jgi:hypothetical protein
MRARGNNSPFMVNSTLTINPDSAGLLAKAGGPARLAAACCRKVAVAPPVLQ